MRYSEIEPIGVRGKGKGEREGNVIWLKDFLKKKKMDISQDEEARTWTVILWGI